MPDESNASVQAEISVAEGSTSHLGARRLYRIGIPLERLIPPPGAVERQAERGDAWGAGVDTFELRDSQLIFQDRERGVLKVEVVADVGSSSAVFADESACGAVECPILRIKPVWRGGREKFERHDSGCALDYTDVSNDLDRAAQMTRQKLPIGIQTFREIREDGCYYVDKTVFALRLIEQGKYYFLSRPRRFGKSLFLDTLAELFAGNEGLFRGLYAYGRWDWSVRYPVIRMSFGGGVMQSPEQLERKIREQLRINQAALDLTCTETDVDGCFAELIREAHASSGQRVVVLVDEYDKPILDNLTRPALAVEIRDGLRNLYSVIKDSDAHIRFAFLTGVSKFSKVSLFSGLNNLRDITVSPEYSAICGYTEGDLDTVFAPELDGLDRDEIRRWYNGYNWTGESVYNPFDVLLLFQEREFRAWWFETATPTFLIDLLTERHAWLPSLGALETDEAMLSAFEVADISTEALMFQTGYLTFAGQEIRFGEHWYRLRYPNHEVYRSLNNGLLVAWTSDRRAMLGNKRRLGDLLLANDFSGMETLFGALFAGIPSEWFTNNPIARYEGYYASVFYAYFASLGLDIVAEESSNAGRLDMAVRFRGQVYLFEFKVVELSPEGRALQQIKDRGYGNKYAGEGVPIHLIGVEFSRERRTLVGFEVESWAAS